MTTNTNTPAVSTVALNVAANMTANNAPETAIADAMAQAAAKAEAIKAEKPVEPTAADRITAFGLVYTIGDAADAICAFLRTWSHNQSYARLQLMVAHIARAKGVARDASGDIAVDARADIEALIKKPGCKSQDSNRRTEAEEKLFSAAAMFVSYWRKKAGVDTGTARGRKTKTGDAKTGDAKTNNTKTGDAKAKASDATVPSEITSEPERDVNYVADHIMSQLTTLLQFANKHATLEGVAPWLELVTKAHGAATRLVAGMSEPEPPAAPKSETVTPKAQKVGDAAARKLHNRRVLEARKEHERKVKELQKVIAS